VAFGIGAATSQPPEFLAYFESRGRRCCGSVSLQVRYIKSTFQCTVKRSMTVDFGPALNRGISPAWASMVEVKEETFCDCI